MTSTNPAPFAIRPIAPPEFETFADAVERAFGAAPHPDDLEVYRGVFEFERSLAAFDRDEVVGTAAAATFSLAVPGGRVDTAGITAVSVQPTHRRRGVLTSLMHRQLADVHDRGEPLALLWASESAIYGRFGYGLASHRLGVELRRGQAALRADAPGGTHVRAADPGKEQPLLADVYARAERPGCFARDSRWWANRLADPAHRRGRASPLRCVVAEQDGRPVGYALYATEPRWDDGVPGGAVKVRELAATTPAGHADLWRYLTGIDLMDSVECWALPVDDPLVHLLRDWRRARARAGDALWARVVDVPAALAARRYAAAVDVVLEVRDPLCPWNDGRWRLRGDRDGAECARTDADPDVVTGVEELGAVYLGGTPLSALAAAGRVNERRRGALGPAGTAFGWDVAPYCPLVF